MKIAVLLTTPDDWGDLACKYGAYFTRQMLIPYIASKGLEFKDLQNTECEVGPFYQEAAKRYSFFKGFGHGNSTQFAGFKNHILIDAAVSDFAVWQETMVHLLSCTTGKTLGKKFPKTFVGYADTYYFMAARTTTPPNSLAKPYFDSDFEYDRQLLSGATHGEAFEAMRAKYKEWYDKSDPATRQYLLWDRSIAVMYGDPNTKHPGAPPPPPPPPPPKPTPEQCAIYVCTLPAWLRKWLKCGLP